MSQPSSGQVHPSCFWDKMMLGARRHLPPTAGPPTARYERVCACVDAPVLPREAGVWAVVSLVPDVDRYIDVLHHSSHLG
jgi:hypothetical protein